MPSPLAPSAMVRPMASRSAFTKRPGWQGFFIGICSPSSVVIYKVDVGRAAVPKSEDNPPVGAHGHGPETFELSLERMKPEGRMVQLFDGDGSVERGENFADAVHHLGGQSSCIVLPI